MNLDKTEKFWDKLANKFDRQSKYFQSLPVEQAKKYLKDSDIVLDFGSATGTVSNEVASYVKKVIGIDISKKMIDIAKRKSLELKVGNVDYKQATIFDEIIERESFDVVLAFNILHFFKDTKEILQQINKLLKPNGLIIIKIACLGQWSFSNVLQRLIFSPLIWGKIIPYMKFIKLSELDNALNSSGLQTIAKENTSTNYFIVARKI